MKRIAIAGNPNSGKTCLFNNMTGANQRVGNYPGVTVEFVTGETKLGKEKTQVIDLPGTYSLTAYSQEELVARDFIVNERPDVIINVVDASNLERNLYLTAQLIELNVPIVIALNMVDVADKKGVSIDVKRLSEILGVEVVRTAANRNIGFNELKTACKKTIDEKILPKPISYSHELQSSFPALLDAVKGNAELYGHYPPKWTVIKLLEDDDQVLKQLESNKDCENIKKLLKQAKQHLFDHSHEDSATAVVESRYGFANGVCREVSVMSEVAKQMLTDKLDRIVCNRFLGPIILCAIVYLMFTFTFGVAEDLTWIPLFNGEWVSPTGLFELIFERFSNIANAYIKTPWLLSLVDEGIISGVGGVLGFVPLIFFMFMFIAVLEDTGYIARVAFILDRILRIFGLQGKSVLAMIVSGGFGAGGCAVPGVMATRTLREEKDRLITILVAPFMNCGAKMPVYAMLIAAFFSHSRGAMMFLLWLLSWAFALGSALMLRKFVIKGEQTPFVMELPVYHLPTIRGVLMDTWNRTYMYIKKAATVILAFAIILWALMYYPRTDVSDLEQARDKAAQEFRIAAQRSPYAPLLTEEKLEGTIELYEAEEREESDELHTRMFAELDMIKSGTEVHNQETLQAFLAYIDASHDLSGQIKQRNLENSFAGRLGRSLTPISRLAGFDWKENIALIGGFAAKEVILGTMGTAYAMDKADEESLSQYIAASPDWSRLRAFAMLVFVMAYAPCMVTIAAIKKETGKWRWAIFASVYSTVLAFVVATIIFQLGSLL